MGRLQAGEGSVYASTWESFAPYFAEYVGTFAICMAFICNFSLNSDPYYTVMSNAFMVAAIVYASRHLSGANLNPSVSIALCLSGRRTPRVCMLLVIAQILGAVTAALFRVEVSTGPSVETHFQQLGPNPGYNWFQVGLLEVLYTSMLCFVYLNCASSSENNPKDDQNGFSGLAYGMCVVAGGFAGQGLGDTVMNSAVAIGLGITNTTMGGVTGRGAAYFVYDLLGAFLGVGAYRVVRPKEFESSSEVGRGTEQVVRSRQESSQLAAEFIGTFYIVLTQVLSKISTDESSTPSDLGPEALGTGAAVISMVYSLRNISGGHFNPVVTFSVKSAGRFCPEEEDNDMVNLDEPRMIMFYVVSQVLAGVAAASIAVLLRKSYPSSHARVDSSVTESQTMLAEVAFSFFLCYVILATSTTTPVIGARSKQNNISGLAYGSSVMAGILAVGDVSGALLNPSVVMSFMCLGLMDQEGSLLPLIFYQTIGGILAAAAFMVTHAPLYIKAHQNAEDEIAA